MKSEGVIFKFDEVVLRVFWFFYFRENRGGLDEFKEPLNLSEVRTTSCRFPFGAFKGVSCFLSSSRGDGKRSERISIEVEWECSFQERRFAENRVQSIIARLIEHEENRNQSEDGQ